MVTILQLLNKLLTRYDYRVYFYRSSVTNQISFGVLKREAFGLVKTVLDVTLPKTYRGLIHRINPLFYLERNRWRKLAERLKK